LKGSEASTPYGINAVKGSWLDDHTFAVERPILGQGETQKWTLAFDRKKVDVIFESTDGANADLRMNDGYSWSRTPGYLTAPNRRQDCRSLFCKRATNASPPDRV